jgi:hypothetical protein
MVLNLLLLPRVLPRWMLDLLVYSCLTCPFIPLALNSPVDNVGTSWSDTSGDDVGAKLLVFKSGALVCKKFAAFAQEEIEHYKEKSISWRNQE